MAVSKDQIRKTLLTAEPVKHIRLVQRGSTSLRAGFKKVAPASPQLCLGSGMDETIPSGPSPPCSSPLLSERIKAPEGVVFFSQSLWV